MKSGICCALLVGTLVMGCTKKPTAMTVCQKIEATGVGKNCREGKPGGLGAAAIEDAAFDLPSVPGKGGAVMRFENEGAYDRTVDAFERAAMLAGPHRYGSKRALIFVQMNEGLSMEDGRKVRSVVDAL